MLQEALQNTVNVNNVDFLKKSYSNEEYFESLKKEFGEALDNTNKCIVLYGSETGNAEQLA